MEQLEKLGQGRQLHWYLCLPNQGEPMHPIVPKRLNPSIHAGLRAMRGVRFPVKRARPPNAGFWPISGRRPDAVYQALSKRQTAKSRQSGGSQAGELWEWKADQRGA